MKIFLFIFITSLIFKNALSIETKIIHKIENEIITNIDIKHEFKYLMALNRSLKELDKKRILSISNESIIREKIKKIEISRNFKEIKIDQKYLNTLLKNKYSRLGIKSLDEFKIYLKEYDLTLEDVIEKVTIETLWNDLIVKIYASQINIDEKKIKEEISKNKKVQSLEYLLSEIVFDIKNKNEIKKKYAEVLNSIKEIGFENSASIYSISETSKIGGSTGWINENSLNNKIKKSLNNLKIGDTTEPIILSNGILILKIENTRKVKIKIDEKSELKQAIIYEQNRQLSQYSKIYYNKIKKNLDFNG
jgi:peptidyl-prolyl cis-trans isomerase SurA